MSNHKPFFLSVLLRPGHGYLHDNPGFRPPGLRTSARPKNGSLSRIRFPTTSLPPRHERLRTSSPTGCSFPPTSSTAVPASESFPVHTVHVLNEARKNPPMLLRTCGHRQAYGGSSSRPAVAMARRKSPCSSSSAVNNLRLAPRLFRAEDRKKKRLCIHRRPAPSAGLGLPENV